MKFTKMQGAGNDYVYIYGLGDTTRDLPELARRLSNRNFGVGSDGLILIDPAGKEGADFRMRMFNADGSASAMCGNGIRCVGKYVFDKGHTSATDVAIATDAGVKYLTLYPEGGRVKRVRVDMGLPGLAPSEIPVNLAGERVVDYPFAVNDCETVRITCVSMGNPHAVMFVPDVSDIPLERLGPEIEFHPIFPERTNVEFVEVVSPSHLKMRVWERGTGETLACGTGACASLVAAVLNGKAERRATLELLGGDLSIEWAEDGHVYMTGPAETVFEGDFVAEL
jgi:diaminopimelate epimerase